MQKEVPPSGWHLLLFALLCPLTLLACSDSEEPGIVIPDNWITVQTDQLDFPYEGGSEQREFTLAEGLDAAQVTASFSSDGEEWLTATLADGKLSLLCEHSYVERARSSQLTLAYDDTHKCNIYIAQKAAPSSADQQIRVVGGEATSEMETNPFSNSYDGNKSTFFNSVTGAVTYPFYLTYELQAGHTLNRIVYTPRTDSGNKWGSFDEFSVEVSTADAPDVFTPVGTYARGNGVHTAYNIRLSEGVENVSKVRFVVTKGYEDRVSCAEMEFYEASRHKFDLTTVFADDMGTRLKEGVTAKQINQIPNSYLKELGLALLNGTYDSDYRLADYRPYQHPSVMAAKNKTSKYSLRDNPTGIYAKANETLPVFVGEIYEGGKISLLIQDLNGGYNNYKTYDLEEGYNEVTVEVGGLIYILNHVESDIPLLAEEGDAAQQKEIADKTVTVHFGAGKVNGYFDTSKHTAADWTQIRDNAGYQDIDVLGKYSHVTWRVSDFKKYNTDITRTVENTDRLVYLQQEFMGLVKYDKMFNNRMHLCIDYQAKSPNASDYRTVYNASDYYAEPFCDPDRFGARCWGPAHEVGHCNQTRPGLKWAGMTEVTNNIMSLHVQTSFGQSCKLLVDGCKPKVENGSILGEYASIYEGARALIVDGNRAHSLPDISDIVRETQLVPFWQLKLYLIDVLGQEDFYHDLYEHFRTHESPSERGENAGMDQLDFVRQVCAISGYDLTTFFGSWGFLRQANATLNDYGDKSFSITTKEVEDLRAEIKSKTERGEYKTPPANLHLIQEDNLDNYR